MKKLHGMPESVLFTHAYSRSTAFESGNSSTNVLLNQDKIQRVPSPESLSSFHSSVFPEANFCRINSNAKKEKEILKIVQTK